MSDRDKMAQIMRGKEAQNAAQALRKHNVKEKEMAPHRDTSQHRKKTAEKSANEQAKTSQTRTQAVQKRQAQTQERSQQMMEHEKYQQQQQQQQQGKGR